ncbi:MAG TPA: hypothetical protein VGV93_01825 [Acidimicrobiales bacterium]|nr:hypothetical protein [Acidimicrobiales bacterium]
MTSVQDTGQGAADELKQKGEQAAERTQQKAQQAGEEAKSKLRQEVDQRSQQVAEQVESTADAIRKTGEELRKQGKVNSERVAATAVRGPGASRARAALLYHLVRMERPSRRRCGWRPSSVRLPAREGTPIA